jgi:16S rRNA (cytosine1402-N4)-methyltransferase
MLQHQPVLLAEVTASLSLSEGGIYVDGTFGRGGHSRAILADLGPGGRLLAIDRDPEAVAAGRALAALDPRLEILHGEFSRLGPWLEERGWHGRVRGILLDLGVSSPQLDDPARGFSFARSGPLDMRMNPAGDQPDAATWLARAREEDLARVLWELGEERFSRRIARAIVAARREGPILDTGRLAGIIAAAAPSREPGRHPATRSFQAIRIHINRELEELGATLGQALEALAVGGRLAVISFHSLEDRLVKRFFRAGEQGDRLPRGVPVTAAALRPRLRLIGRAIRPGAAELAANPRCRSAVLRVAEKLA